MSLLVNEIQRNGLLRAKGVVILDTGHHLTSHPMDIFSAMNLSLVPCTSPKYHLPTFQVSSLDL